MNIYSRIQVNKKDSSTHVFLGIYAAIGAVIFIYLTKLGDQDRERGETYSTIALFAYFLVPIVGIGLLMAI